jgi:hypothetical protein
MKKILLFLLLLSGVAFAQPKAYNVQQYCIDEAPFKQGDCDQLGNEYSFVFVDAEKQKVDFFLTDIKLHYTIESVEAATESNETRYMLTNTQGTIMMTINRQKTAIAFFYPDKHIYLKVGASTKLP